MEENFVFFGMGNEACYQKWSEKNYYSHSIYKYHCSDGICSTEHLWRRECLEHHSNVDPEHIKDDRLQEKMKLATENWDYPIIVTTNVQLFESMFSNKPSVCRKLHNIVNSVIILDEVQTLPMDYLQPVVDSLKTYHKLFNVSFLFTTASQPVLSGLIEGCNPKTAFKGIDHITEIIPSEFKLYDKLRRVKLSINNEGRTYDEVAEMLSKHKECFVL